MNPMGQRLILAIRVWSAIRGGRYSRRENRCLAFVQREQLDEVQSVKDLNPSVFRARDFLRADLSS